MTRRQVVWVSPALNANPRTGGQLRSHRLLESLTASADVDVVLIQDTDAGDLETSAGARSVRQFSRPKSPIGNRLLAARNGLPLYCQRLWNPEAGRHVDSLLDEATVVVLDHLWVASYGRKAHRRILSVHNAEAELLRSLPMPDPLWRRIERRREIARTRALEERMLGAPGVVGIAVSESDAEALGGRVRVVPNGADIPHSIPELPSKGLILFIGSLDWLPNAAAVTWWSEHVWPTLPDQRQPLTVVGRCGQVAGDALARLPGVRLVGEVESVSMYLSQASVIAVPLQHGGGSRLKILEALAWQRPVVTTAKGAEGLPAALRSHLVIVDSPEQFGKAVVNLLDDNDRARAIASCGSSIVEQFSWERLGRDFSAIVLDSMND